MSGKTVGIVGGGLAGLSAAAALGSAGYRVRLFEARPFLGGRATSYPVPSGDEVIDNCQHILLRCCHNLIDFYGRLGVTRSVEFHREFFWVEPGGRTSVLKRGVLPAPAHFTESFAKLKFLSVRDKAAVARGLLAVGRDYQSRADAEQITMMDWLGEQGQTPRAIQRFWQQVLVSAINEDLPRMAASHGLQVFYSGFLQNARSYEMGIPSVPLADLYSDQAWRSFPNVALCHRAPVEAIAVENNKAVRLRIGEEWQPVDAVVVAVPFERVQPLVPQLSLDLQAFHHSPITGIHLWFDRPITSLPHATLLDRTIHWLFNKSGGTHIQLVVSASRTLTEKSKNDVVALALQELGEFFPATRQARLERSHVVKEMRATFSAAPGLELARPLAVTSISNLYLAGDWTRSGWPATMEGAVRSGYLAAEALTKAEGHPWSFLKPS